MGKKNYKIVGLAQWAKVFGEPELNYNEDGNEWTIDLEPNEDGVNLIERLGLGKKLLRKGRTNKNGVVQTRESYISFSRAEIKRSGEHKGEHNDHIPVTTIEGLEWPDDVSIGNGSTVEIKFGIFMVPAKGKFAGGPKPVIYGIKVLDLKKYERPEKKGAKTESNKPAATAEESYSE